jgi:hypothetical protein
MNEKENKSRDSEELDKLLSMRGKPFADWKEERKYLREKWGMQGRQVDPVSVDKENDENQEKKV